MTLDRHRSQLIPDVVYAGDGTIFVTDREGTFPLRHGKGEKGDVRDMDFAPEYQSFRSYDPKRDKNNDSERRYKQRSSRYGAEIQTLSGTISTQSSHSLARKLRRTKSLSKRQEAEDKYGSYNGSGGSTGRGRRLRGDTPKMTPEFAASLREKREKAEAKRRSLENLSYTSNGSIHKKRRGSKDDISNGYGRFPLIDDPMFRHRKIHQESLPYVLFVVDAVMLLCVGIARVVLVYCHQYFGPVWTALVLLIFGIIGARHKGEYLTTYKNVGYIFFGFLSAICTMVASGLNLRVLIPTLYLLITHKSPDVVATSVAFSNWGNKTITGIELQPKLITWIELGLDISTLMFLFIGFSSLTAAMIGFGNFWDASYDTTGECDHRGNPRLFNPLEQMVLGQAVTFVGIVVVLLIDYVDTDQAFYHYYSPVWTGVIIIFAGFGSTCFGRRPDRSCWGVNAFFLEIFALGACAAATTLLALSLVDNARDLVTYKNLPEEERQKWIVCCVAQGLYIFLMIFALVFTCGVLFRVMQTLCCRSCLDGKPGSLPNNNNTEWSGR